MANITTTDVDRGGVVLEMGKSRDVTIEYRHADDTYVEGTLLAFETTEKTYTAYIKDSNTRGKGLPRAILTYTPDNVPAVPAIGNTFKARAMFTGCVREERLKITDGAAVDVAVDESVVAAVTQNSQLAVQSARELSDRG